MSDEIIISRTTPANQSIQKQSFPTEIIDLPSKGYFYPKNSILSSGQIEIKMMTAKEEDILTNPNLLKKGMAIDKLLDSLIIDKNINPSELLIGDKNALIFAVRRLAYGDSYGPVEIKCPKCQASNQVNVDLSQLNQKDFDETKYEPGVNVFSYTLPYSKSNIKFKLLTDADEKDIERENTAMNKINKGGSSEITLRLKKTIVAVDGDDNPAKIKTFVENMQSRDSLEFRKHVRSITPDVDSTFDFCCKECGAEERAAVPMTVQFFWPDSRV